MVKKGAIVKQDYGGIFRGVTRGSTLMDVFAFIKGVEGVSVKLNGGNFCFQFFYNMVVEMEKGLCN